MSHLSPDETSPITPDVWPPFPPVGETELERALRLEEEKEAKKISDEIDRAIERDKQAYKKKKFATRILLLGTCSTTLKAYSGCLDI